MGRQGSGSAVMVVGVMLMGFGVLLAGAASSPSTATVTFPVGNADALWDIPSTTNGLDYDAWSASKSFKFGDEILFKYSNQSHSVLRVNASSYANCVLDDAIDSWTSGEDVIALNVPNTTDYYFVCGFIGHCGLKQKVHVSVAALGSPPNVPEVSSPPSPKSDAQMSFLSAGALVSSLVMVFLSTLAVS